MPINKCGKEYVLEIQNGKRAWGLLAKESINVRVISTDGEPFLAIKTENMEPTDEFDANTVTLETVEDVKQLADILCQILEEANHAKH